MLSFCRLYLLHSFQFLSLMCKDLGHTYSLNSWAKIPFTEKKKEIALHDISPLKLCATAIYIQVHCFLVSMPLIKSAISLSTSFSRRHMRTETSIQKRTLSKHKGSSVLLFMFIVYHDLLLLQLLVEHFCIRQHDFESSNTILTLNSIFVSCRKKFVAHCS